MDTFDVAVGNPPYQDDRNTSVYQHFVGTAHAFSEHVSLIHPVRWTLGGRGSGLSEFRDKEISSTKYVRFIVSSDEDFFGNVIVKGGVCYYLWSKNWSGRLGYVFDGIYEKRISLLDGDRVFVSRPEMRAVSQKVNPKHHVKTCSRSHYGKQVESEEGIRRIETSENDEGSLKIYFSGQAGGVNTAYVPSTATSRETNTYKLVATKTADPKHGTDSLRRLNRLIILGPGEIVSTSFVVISEMDSLREAENLLRYLKTDFATFLFGILASTQDASARVYTLIPAVDPSTGEIKDKPEVDIDFTVGTVDEIDDQLAEIYGLTDEDRELMRKSIKPWKGKNSLTADGLY